MKKTLALIPFLLMHFANYGLTSSCTAVLPDTINAPAGKITLVNAQVNCFFLSGLGSTFSGLPPVTIALAPSDIQHIAPFTQDQPIALSQLQTYPTLGNFVAFEYKPIKGALAGQPIQVVIRTEPVSDTFKNILQQQLQAAQKANNSQQIADLTNTLINIGSKPMVQFYRRLPSIGQVQFKPLVTKIFDGPAEQQSVEINILPTGNLQIIEGETLEEEAFGKLQ